MKNIKGFYFDNEPGGAGAPPPADPPKDPPKEPPQSPPKEPEPKTIPYDRFKEVNDLKIKAEEELQKIKDGQKAADEKKLQDENKWKELYEKEKTEKASKELELLRLRVAAEKGVPADLVDRLVGATKEELEADADKLLTFVKPGSPGIPPHNKGGGATRLDIKTMSPEEIRKNSEALFNQGNAKE